MNETTQQMIERSIRLFQESTNNRYTHDQIIRKLLEDYGELAQDMLSRNPSCRMTPKFIQECQGTMAAYRYLAERFGDSLDGREDLVEEQRYARIHLEKLLKLELIFGRIN